MAKLTFPPKGKAVAASNGSLGKGGMPRTGTGGTPKVPRNPVKAAMTPNKPPAPAPAPKFPFAKGGLAVKGKAIPSKPPKPVMPAKVAAKPAKPRQMPAAPMPGPMPGAMSMGAGGPPMGSKPPVPAFADGGSFMTGPSDAHMRAIREGQARLQADQMRAAQRAQAAQAKPHPSSTPSMPRMGPYSASDATPSVSPSDGSRIAALGAAGRAVIPRIGLGPAVGGAMMAMGSTPLNQGEDQALSKYRMQDDLAQNAARNIPSRIQPQRSLAQPAGQPDSREIASARGVSYQTPQVRSGQRTPNDSQFRAQQAQDQAERAQTARLNNQQTMVALMKDHGIDSFTYNGQQFAANPDSPSGYASVPGPQVGDLY